MALADLAVAVSHCSLTASDQCDTSSSTH